MTLAGTLQQMSLEEVLRVIDEERRAGLLLLSTSNGASVAEIYLNRGYILCAQRMGPGQSLAERLIRSQVVTQQQLGHVRSLYRQSIVTEVDLARVLIQTNMLSNKQLRRWAVYDAIEFLIVVLSWNEGQFEFVDGVAPEPGRMVIELPILNVLEDALYHIARRRQRVSDAHVAVTPDLVLDFADSVDPPNGEVQVTPEQWQFLTAVDGRQPLSEVGKSLRLSRDKTYQLAAELLALKLLTVRNQPRDGSSRVRISEERAFSSLPPARTSRALPAPPDMSGPGPAIQGRAQRRQHFMR